MFAKEALAGDGEVARSRFHVQANRLGHEMRQMRNSNVERALPPYLSLIGKGGSFRLSGRTGLTLAIIIGGLRVSSLAPSASFSRWPQVPPSSMPMRIRRCPQE